MLSVPHAFGLAVFDDTVYWTDWTRLGVMSIHKFGAEKSNVVWTNNQSQVYPMAIKVYHKIVQLTGRFHKCSRRCLLKYELSLKIV